MVPLIYKRFRHTEEGRKYWVFRVDLHRSFPFLHVYLFQYENKEWDLQQLLKKVRHSIDPGLTEV